jgi:DNA polymerase III epsilon subunit-like protein
MTQKLIFLDLETTGLDTETCEIIEVAYQVGDHSAAIIQKLFKPQTPIPFEVSGITNIDNADVEDKSAFRYSPLSEELEEFASSDRIAVTHNTDFDLAVLDRHGIKFNRSICTYKLAWKLLPDLANHKLGTLRAYFGIPHGDGVAHRADYDVEILEQVFNKLWFLAKMDELEGNQEDAINSFIELSDQAKLEYQDIFHFGKYKGQKISEIAKSDFGYIQWCLKNVEDKKLKQYLLSL